MGGWCKQNNPSSKWAKLFWNCYATNPLNASISAEKLCLIMVKRLNPTLGFAKTQISYMLILKNLITYIFIKIYC